MAAFEPEIGIWESLLERVRLCPRRKGDLPPERLLRDWAQQYNLDYP
jgi:hypothetical protein